MFTMLPLYPRHVSTCNCIGQAIFMLENYRLNRFRLLLPYISRFKYFRFNIKT